MKKILVVGSLNMDVSVRMERLPAVGETVRGAGCWNNPGGKGANQACAAARLGGQVSLLGCVGADDYGAALLSQLAEAGVDVSAVEQVPDVPTGTAFIFTDTAANNSIVILSGANERCTVPYIQRHEDQLRECDLVMLQLEVPLETVCYVVERASALGKRVILDPAPAPRDLPERLLREVDILTPNETELALLSGQKAQGAEQLAEAAGRLLAKGSGCVLTTLGAEGVLLSTPEESRLIPGVKAKAVDTTAAGDCFNGALAVELAQGRTVAEAAAFANRAAALSTTRRGAQNSLPKRCEVELP